MGKYMQKNFSTFIFILTNLICLNSYSAERNLIKLSKAFKSFLLKKRAIPVVNSNFYKNYRNYNNHQKKQSTFNFKPALPIMAVSPWLTFSSDDKEHTEDNKTEEKNIDQFKSLILELCKNKYFFDLEACIPTYLLGQYRYNARSYGQFILDNTDTFKVENQREAERAGRDIWKVVWKKDVLTVKSLKVKNVAVRYVVEYNVDDEESLSQICSLASEISNILDTNPDIILSNEFKLFALKLGKIRLHLQEHTSEPSF